MGQAVDCTRITVKGARPFEDDTTAYELCDITQDMFMYRHNVLFQLMSLSTRAFVFWFEIFGEYCTDENSFVS